MSKNYNLVSFVSPDGTVTTSFEVTPPMSTYWVAFAILDFPHAISVPKNRALELQYRIFAQADRLSTASTSFALETSSKMMYALQDYFRAPYPLSKMDLIAIPNSSETGATASWGAYGHAACKFWTI